MQPSTKTTLDDLYEWLRKLDQPAVMRFFSALPPEHADVIRERVFAAAMRAEDENTLRFTSALGSDPREVIDTGCCSEDDPKLPLCAALVTKRFSVAKVITDHICREYPIGDLDNILDQVLFEKQRVYQTRYKYFSVWSGIRRIFLDAGVKPTFRFFQFARRDHEFLDRILGGCKDSIIDHIQSGLLAQCLREDEYQRQGRCSSLHRIVLTFFLKDMVRKLNPELSAPALCQAFRVASEFRCSWAIATILEAASSLDIELQSVGSDQATNIALVSPHPCNVGSLDDALEQTFNALRKENEVYDHDESTPKWKHLMYRVKTEDLSEIVIFEDHFKTAYNLGCYEMMIAISGRLDLRHFHSTTSSNLWGNYDALKLLAYNTNIDGVDSLHIKDSNGTILDLLPLSPPGEAILRRDLKAAKILIKGKADINGLVALNYYEDAGYREAIDSTLSRASPLLAAIDTKNLPMVQLLVAAGADVDHRPRLGLVRTPLRRAAKIGNFAIVEPLLNRGANADSTPC
ncbi:hypothetical protein EK21DRAFT_114623 [Setomelanomma holmii]|uniref:Uncharacterized protein n=1 Tax=Setomelanomma holmii TaxID=210430 RepID=A0A9P4H531_9PLEO|nr:hypothetical protein EK21DRAFT_114623 [Setomelanomma holmii]